MSQRKPRGITEEVGDPKYEQPAKLSPTGFAGEKMALGKTPERYMVRVKKVVFEGYITLTEEAAHKLQDELWSSKAEDEETIVFLRRGTPPSATDYKSVEDLKEAIKNG